MPSSEEREETEGAPGSAAEEPSVEEESLEEPSVEEESLEKPSAEEESLEEAIAKLTPEQAEMFMRVLSLTMKKRRLMLGGTLLSLFLLVAGTLAAFLVFATRVPGTFMIWVFLVPFAAAGATMWTFGALAKRAGSETHAPLLEPEVKFSTDSTKKEH